MQVKDLFITRDVSNLVAETESEGESLKKTIGAFGLTAMGVGAIIGTGIFVVIGEGAGMAGPGLVLVVRLGRRDLRVLRVVLRRAGLCGPCRRERVHVHLRHHG